MYTNREGVGNSSHYSREGQRRLPSDGRGAVGGTMSLPGG